MAASCVEDSFIVWYC